MQKIKNKIFVYFHICLINNWEKIVTKILNKINNSGLIDKIENLFLYIVGDTNQDNLEKIKKIESLNSKYKIKSFKKDIQTFEKLTLNSLLDDCKDKYDDCKILYLHSKGVTRVGNKYVEDWVNYLIYFNVNKHEDCIKALDKYDTCGVNYSMIHSRHYSGNFWWATSNYIKTLNPLVIILEEIKNKKLKAKYYLESEMWICSKTSNSISLHNSNVNHYHQEYKEDKYIEKN